MIEVYHQTVGRNCLLELDLTPDRSGLIPANYAARYKQLGDLSAPAIASLLRRKLHTLQMIKACILLHSIILPTSIVLC